MEWRTKYSHFELNKIAFDKKNDQVFDENEI